MRLIISLILCVAGPRTDSLSLAPRSQTVADQPPLTAPERVAIERLALARARAGLSDKTRALPLSDGLTVGDWAADDVSLDRALRGWTRALPRYAVPRFYSDGTCDVDIRLRPDELRDQLLTWRAEFTPTNPAPGLFRKSAKQWPVLWQTGSAAKSETQATSKPPGWENIGVDGVQLARRAARSDACLALLSEAEHLKVTNARRLADFLNSSDAVRDAVLSAIEKAADIEIRSDPDQVASATAAIAIPDLIRILTDVHAALYKGDVFHAADFREMALLARQKQLRATGLGVPPRSTRTQPRYVQIEFNEPPWITQTLRAVGRYEPQDEDGDLPEEVRVEIARLSGMDALRRQVEALVIQGDVTVEQFLGGHRELKRDVVVFLAGTRLIGTKSVSSDGALEARVELPLGRLWLIVRRGMSLIEVDPVGKQSTP